MLELGLLTVERSKQRGNVQLFTSRKLLKSQNVFIHVSPIVVGTKDLEELAMNVKVVITVQPVVGQMMILTLV